MKNSHRVVVKLGTQILTDENGTLARERLAHIVHQIAQLSSNGFEVVVVTSGAVGLGRAALGFSQKNLSLAQKQASAAVGQTQLMQEYQNLFSPLGLGVAQMLLAGDDFCDRGRYLNFQKTLEELVLKRFIPIINENDTVSVAELRDDARSGFGDNDKLSALVAGKCGAQTLVILSNVDGVFDKNPNVYADAKRIECIKGLRELRSIQTVGQSSGGRGGMQAKLEAVRVACLSGVKTIITTGYRHNTILHALGFGDSKDFESSFLQWGTVVEPEPSSVISARKQWIGFASGYEGVLVVDQNAEMALIERKASLLPAGIHSVSGEFKGGVVVSVQSLRGTEIGRGLTPFSADILRAAAGRPSSDLKTILGGSVAPQPEIIHRDDFVIFVDTDSGDSR